jgi:Copper binding periplasmic protein CusF
VIEIEPLVMTPCSPGSGTGLRISPRPRFGPSVRWHQDLEEWSLANLDMPSMTMVFRVKDPAMLDQVKEGDKIKFSADRIDGAITVTEIQLTK